MKPSSLVSHVAAALLALEALAIAAACSSSDDDSPPPFQGGYCSGANCGNSHSTGGTDGGKKDVATSDVVDASDAAADSPYDGPTTTIGGLLFAMDPPSFSMDGSSIQYPWLNQSTVRIWSSGHVWSSPYAEATGFKFTDIAVGPSVVLVQEDPGQGEGMVPTALFIDTSEQNATWNLPVVTRPSMSVIYGSVQPQRVLDPNRAQWLLSFRACAGSSGRKSNVVVKAPADSEGVIYDRATSWELNAQDGTGDSGIGIVVNVPASSAPGQMVRVKYTIDGKDYESEPFPSVQGFMSRFEIVPPC